MREGGTARPVLAVELSDCESSAFGEARRTLGRHGYVAYFPAPIPRSIELPTRTVASINDRRECFRERRRPSSALAGSPGQEQREHGIDAGVQLRSPRGKRRARGSRGAWPRAAPRRPRCRRSAPGSGSSTRLFPDADMLSFVIIDYSGATALLADPETEARARQASPGPRWRRNRWNSRAMTSPLGSSGATAASSSRAAASSRSTKAWTSGSCATAVETCAS